MSVNDHHRLAALVFCRTDLKFELNEHWAIQFSTGATTAVLEKGPDALINSFFSWASVMARVIYSVNRCLVLLTIPPSFKNA